MLRIRLQRRGKKNYATYRIVVANQRAPIKGRFIADLGYYNPHTDEFKVNEDVKKWIDNGAKATNTVHNLLVTHKIIDADKVTSWRPKKKKVEDEAEEGKKEEKAEKKTENTEEDKKAEEAKK